MTNRTKIIAITGAESTGKSTLAKTLAHHYKVPFIEEYARTYVEQLNRPYNYDDIIFIAKKQVEQYHEMVSKQVPFIILDTWLFITKIWLEVVYGEAPKWIDKIIRETAIDLFLVCDTDMPWVADNIRENGGLDREKLQNNYIQELQKFDFPYRIIEGKLEDRKQAAIKIISSLA